MRTSNRIILTLAWLAYSGIAHGAVADADIHEAAFACGPFTSQSGEALDDRATYLILDPQDTAGPLPDALGLRVTSSHRSRTSSMLLSDIQSGEGAIYTSNQTDAQIIYSIAPSMPGLPSFYVGVRKFVNGVEYHANCR